jgi:hypothetical protein
MMGQIIRGRIFPLFVKAQKEYKKRKKGGNQKPGERGILVLPPLQEPAPEMKAAEIKSQIKWKSQK